MQIGNGEPLIANIKFFLANNLFTFLLLKFPSPEAIFVYYILSLHCKVNTVSTKREKQMSSFLRALQHFYIFLHFMLIVQGKCYLSQYESFLS